MKIVALLLGHATAYLFSGFGGVLLNESCQSVVFKGSKGVYLDAFRQAKAAFALEIDNVCFVEEIFDGLNELTAPDILFYPKHDVSSARKCLLPGLPPPQVYSGSPIASDIVNFINRHAHTFRQVDGSNLAIAKSVKTLEENLYTVDKDDAKCKVIDANEMTLEMFKDHVLRNEPLIIQNAATKSMLSPSWSTKRLLERIGSNEVHVKVSPDGNFEGCEPLEWWQSSDSVQIPDFVLQNLESPDLVLVRPASTNMPFAEFIKHLISTIESNTSYYLEYLSLTTYVPELLQDIPSYSWADFLQLHVQNLWFGDGKSVGKLHFDAFENIMVMVDGAKEFVLYDPSDNSRFYEGHIREAKYDLHRDHFYRENLMESTSMVNSPIDINSPDLARYPLFKQAKSMNCLINEGDALYLPAYWWHEVRSYPAKGDHRNVAVNFWYTPVYDKSFPCKTCKLQFNVDYLNLLNEVNEKDEL
ncbi:hypothetical protein THRCLA_07404 [Thraustotheca clavata]|uniref:Secreted protein n=1 Tax=Thraustotheca clavata TaxID=74557 RepID=A0A0A7CMC3_9STRA|nr:secreted protein [Thraustotheca clavata]OQR96007.1 hypothetical protein THRCLA_07404 [Thraustotheca clavata]